VSPDRDGANRAFDEAIAKFEEALSKIDAALAAQPSGEEAAHLNALEALADASPMMKRQNAFNAAMVHEIRHQRSMQRAVIELLRCQSALVAFLRTVKPYVDTRDFADVLRAISDDDLKRSDALLARDRRRELQLADVEAELKAIRARLDELRRTVAS
jgi:uncharacterized protein YjiS (DUF1127 family)